MREAFLQVVVEEAVVAVDRVRVVANRVGVAPLLQVDVAEQRVDMTLAGQRTQRLLCRAFRIGRPVVGERGAAFVVGFVTRLPLA